MIIVWELKAEAECLELGSGWDLFVLRFILRCLKFEAPEWINALATTGGQMAQWLGVFRPVLVQERGATPGWDGVKELYYNLQHNIECNVI